MATRLIRRPALVRTAVENAGLRRTRKAQPFGDSACAGQRSGINQAGRQVLRLNHLQLDLPYRRYLSSAAPLSSPTTITAHSTNTMAIEVTPLPLPPSADASKFADFGREVKGVNPGSLTDDQFKEIADLLYKVNVFTSPASVG